MSTDSSGHDLSDKRVTGDTIVKEAMAARAALTKVKAELAAVKKDRDELLVEYGDLQKAKYPTPPKHVTKHRRKEDFIRVIANDVLGSMMDRPAVEAFLADLKQWNPDEVILNGDIVECGGFLAAHHTLGYVAQTEYTWQDDIAAGNWFLDEVQKAAPKATIHFLEGNHEDRPERWIIDQTMRHARDSEFLRNLLSADTLLRLKERGIHYYRRGIHHVKGLPPGGSSSARFSSSTNSGAAKMQLSVQSAEPQATWFMPTPTKRQRRQRCSRALAW